MVRIASFALLALAQLVVGDAVKDLQDKGRPNVNNLVAKSKTCTKEKLKIRKEWYAEFKKFCGG
jgi:tyrosinase